MAEAIVHCFDCRDGDDHKRWRYLCEECAEEQLYEHKKTTGHQPYMVVTPDMTAAELRDQISKASEKIRGLA